jgi:uncharacterized protein
VSSLRVLPDPVWLHRFSAGGELDLSTLGGSWWSVTCSGTEISVATEQHEVDDAEQTNGPFRVFQVHGSIDHRTSGVVANVSRPLAEAGISIFAMSTFDSCNVLVLAERLDEAVDALVLAGWEIHS